MERPPEQTKCLACGEALAQALKVAGSLRCHDCRDDRAPLRAEFVEPLSLVPLPRAA